MIVAAVLLPQRLRDIGVETPETLLGTISAATAVVSLVSNLVFGNLSDRSRGRFGRRSPWILLGAILGGVSLTAVGFIPDPLWLTVAYCLSMVGLNMMLAPAVAVLADRVPPTMRGTMSAFYGVGLSAGSPIGSLIGAAFLGNAVPGFILGGALMIVGGVVALMVWPRERSASALPPAAGGLKDLLLSFRPPRKAPDFYLAFVGRLFMLVSYQMVMAYQLYIVQDHVGLSAADTAATIATMSVILLVVGLVGSVVSGPISDLIGRRKLPVVLSSILFAVGVAMPWLMPTPMGMFLYAGIAGFGEEEAGKDLGILNLSTTAGQTIGPLITSAIVVATGSYSTVFLVSIVAAVLGSVFILFIKKRRWFDSGAPENGASHHRGLALTGGRGQSIHGFGGTFNELGYLAISELSEADRETVFRELFHPDELNLRVNRSAIGANDFASSWYSYDETPGDLDLETFSVSRDEQAVIPYIRQAQRYQSDMVLHSAPWSPPTWMKSPPVYNFGTLVETPENLTAYAAYFVRFVQEYAARGIRVDQIHVQNEVFADQKFPSCLWTAEQLRVFIRDYLGPAVEAAGLDTGIFLGTLNGPEDMSFTAAGQKLTNYSRFVDHILFDDEARRHIAGVGYQWAGQHAIARTHADWPELEIIQTESECGFGSNAWEDAEYVFHLARHYLQHGATAYTYWNMALKPGGLSTWGWPQNSLFTIDTDAGTFTRNPEYYVLKHYSAVVRPGAVLRETTGRFGSQGSAYENLDGSLAIVVQNALDRPEAFSFRDPSGRFEEFTAVLEPRSFHSFLLS
ncbi:hypothetical protein HA402_008516 [Bradysia odoriphaga]|nr:hypothetical protein HA402_008516 [Bradysia odoriphaga]